MEQNLQKVKPFMDYVQAVGGLELVLAGGACRDIFHELEPKDYDMFVINQIDPKEVDKVLDKTGVRYEWIDKYGEGRGNPEFNGVFKLRLNDTDIDIIMWNNPVHTPEEIVGKFDSNMNTYWMNKEGEIEFLPDSVHITKEVHAKEGALPERVIKQAKKLGYPMDALFLVVNDTKSIKAFARKYLPKKVKPVLQEEGWFQQWELAPAFNNRNHAVAELARAAAVVRDVEMVDRDIEVAWEPRRRAWLVKVDRGPEFIVREEEVHRQPMGVRRAINNAQRRPF